MSTTLLARTWSERNPGRRRRVPAPIPLHEQKSRILKEIVDSLEYIISHQSKPAEILHFRVRTFFEAIFDAGKSGLKFTEKEGQVIGPLIKKTILDIEYFLEDIGTPFDIDRGPDSLIVRSGFQFMVEDFKDFPDGNGGTIESCFKVFWEEDTIQTLDDSLASWKSDPRGSEENVQHTWKILKRPEDIPVSHHWWF